MIIPEEVKKSIILKQQRSVGEFAPQLEKEYNALIPYLPKECSNIWDIGAGLGGIDVFLSKHYDNPQIYLTDYNESDENIFFGFNDKYCAYNSFDLSKKLLDANGVKNYIFDDLRGVRKLPFEADIIISLLSCCFHYPITEHLTQILYRSWKDTVLILDMRIGYDPTNILEPYFKELARLPYRKWFRYIGVRK